MSLTTQELYNFKSAICELLSDISKIDTKNIDCANYDNETVEETLLNINLEELIVTIEQLQEDANVEMSQLAFAEFDAHLLELQTHLSILLHLSDTDITWDEPPLPETVLDIINKRKEVKKLLEELRRNVSQTHSVIGESKVASTNPKLQHLKEIIQILNKSTKELVARANAVLKIKLKSGK